MSAMKETILEIGGMTCSACVRHVTAALQKLGGVDAVEVSLSERKARVRHAAETPSVAQMTAAIEDAGYDAHVAGGDK